MSADLLELDSCGISVVHRQIRLTAEVYGVACQVRRPSRNGKFVRPRSLQQSDFNTQLPIVATGPHLAVPSVGKYVQNGRSR